MPEKTSRSTRNTTIDTFRLVAAFFVVTIHLFGAKYWNPYSNILAQTFYFMNRLAVPFFFVVTGYFLVVPSKAVGQNKRADFANLTSNITPAHSVNPVKTAIAGGGQLLVKSANDIAVILNNTSDTENLASSDISLTTSLNRIKKSIKKTGVLFALSYSLFMVVFLVYILAGKSKIPHYTIQKVVSFFLWNNVSGLVPNSNVVWYVMAALYALVIMFVFVKVLLCIKNVKLRQILEVAFFIVTLFAYFAGAYLTEKFRFTSYQVNNFLFFALPMIWLGYMIGKYGQVVLQMLTNRVVECFWHKTLKDLGRFDEAYFKAIKIRVTVFVSFVLIAIGSVISVMEIYHVHRKVIIATYFGCPAIIVGLMFLFVQFPNLFSKRLTFIPMLGLKYSVYIYIVHYIIVRALIYFITPPVRLPINILLACSIFLLSLSIGIIYSKFKSAIKHKLSI